MRIQINIFFIIDRLLIHYQKNLGQNGKKKYMKYFNSNKVAQYIIDKTLGIKSKDFYLWDR